MSGILQGFLASLVGRRVPDAPTIGTATATGATTATVSFTAPANNGGATITSYTAVSTPGNKTGTINQSGSGTITVTGLSSGTSYTFVVYATNSVGNSPNSSSSNSITTPVVGQSIYTGPGTYTWVAPAGVTSICVVCVGGGGGSSRNYSGSGGGGLGWRNNISVTPGQSYEIGVGYPGGPGGNGSLSRFGDGLSVRGDGGNTEGSGGSYIGQGGGRGGNGGYDCSAGAGGYSGRGGEDLYSFKNGVGGGGGAGGTDTTGYYNMSGGGGVGLFGQGSDGVGVGAKTYSGGQTVAGGGGGSGGGTGGITSAVIFSYDVEYGGLGGYYGGAGGRGYDPNGSTDYDQPGGNGAVRIIWGAGRAFPSTNTGNY